MPPRQDNESVGDHPKDISAEEKKWDPYRLDKEVGLRMKMADMKYLLGLPDSVVDAPEKAKLRVEMLDAIKVDNLAPLFEELCADPVYKWSSDDVLLAKMKAVNVEELSKIDAQMKDAEDNDGDLEVYDAALAKADYVSKIWDKAAMEKTYLLAHEKALSSGQKIDVYLYIVRSAFMYTDLPLVKKYIDLLEPLVEKSGDWDRRNRLRVYSAIYKVAMRDMEQSAKLLLEAVATFTCFEVLSYKDFVFYTLFSSMVALDRKVNKEKVIDSPEIIAVTRTWPLLAKFTESLHNCDYRGFMESLVAIEPLCVRNRFLSKHVHFHHSFSFRIYFLNYFFRRTFCI